MKLEDFYTYYEHHILTKLSYNSWRFEDPQGSNLWQDWILHNNRFIVIGDAWDSIYYSGAFDSLEGVASCNIHYFSSKCIADKDGYRQEIFDDNKATSIIHKLIFDYWENELDLKNFEDLDWIGIVNEHLQDTLNNVWFEIPEYFSDENDTMQWLREYGHEAAGDAWWDGLNLHSKTRTPYLHLAAVRVATNKI